MLIFDGCAGTGSATKAFADRGHNVEALDIEGDHTYVCDIRDFHPDPKKHYDFMWFSPPCTCFSVAAVHHHWTDKEPNPETLEAIAIVKACLRMIDEAKPAFWVIENPVGMLRSLDFMQDLRKQYFRSTVTYCQYGDTAMKPTDMWHNIPSFYPKRCKKGAKCHAPSPASAPTKGSSQWKTGSMNRAKIPYMLSLAICTAIEKALYSHSSRPEADWVRGKDGRLPDNYYSHENDMSCMVSKSPCSDLIKVG